MSSFRAHLPARRLADHAGPHLSADSFALCGHLRRASNLGTGLSVAVSFDRTIGGGPRWRLGGRIVPLVEVKNSKTETGGDSKCDPLRVRWRAEPVAALLAFQADRRLLHHRPSPGTEDGLVYQSESLAVSDV